MTPYRHLLVATLLVAACGDDGGNSNIDAPPINQCTVTVANEITTYPAMFQGTVNGGGRDHTAAENACAVQTGDQWYDPKGEDIVIKLSGLTNGELYVISLETEDDLSFYVTTDCPPASGAVMGCKVFTDETFTDELGTFTATADTHYLIVDNPEDMAPATGNFTVAVKAAECTVDTEMTDCTAQEPFCVDNECVQCVSAFDCGAAAPVCDLDSTCVASPMQCTGDDARDGGAGDDGPSVAHTLAVPTAGNPTTITGSVCNTPVTEGDWYKLELPAMGDIGVNLSFTGATNDLNVYLLTAAGSIIADGESGPGIHEAIRGNNLMGTYYIVVVQNAPANNLAAVPYTLTVARPTCTKSTECLTAGAPICSAAGTCAAGQNLCTGDDAADTGGTPDDGPAAARDLTGAVGVATSLTGSVCSIADEADFYKVTVTAGQGLIVNLAWTGTADLDPTVYNATGDIVGQSFWLNPEVVTLTYLPAGTYYIGVNNFASSPSATVQAYTITATRTAAQTCTNTTDCAATYSTQIYRGACTGGVCQFITTTGGANGAVCDSAADCTSNRCSYSAFEADAQDSRCTTTCTTTTDCTPLGADFRCTTGFSTNICIPSCQTNLECGANTNSSTLDANQPWNYLTCTPATGVCSP